MEKQFELENSVHIPSVGFGTWQTPNGATAVEAVRCAIEAGYRHIDAAAVYGNEKSVGEGIARSGIDRRELFVTSKVCIAVKYRKSVAQVCIRWALQHEVLPLPKSVTPTRIHENLDVFDFELSVADMRTIDRMEYFGGSGLDPDKIDF